MLKCCSPRISGYEANARVAKIDSINPYSFAMKIETNKVARKIVKTLNK